MSSNNFKNPIATIAANLRLRRAGREFCGNCPVCGYEDSFSIREGDNGSPVGCCHVCHNQDAIFEAMLDAGGGEATGWQREAPTRDDAARCAENAAKQAQTMRWADRLWKGSEPASGTIVETYLAGRGLPGLAASPALRFRANCWHSKAEPAVPAMVALVSGPDGAPLAVHRTYLLPDGSGKAKVEQKKKSLGPIWGGAIRLDPVAAEIVIGEGIETAASAGVLMGLPAWAAISAGNLAAVMLPPAIRGIMIAVDHDEPGMRFADEAADRWVAEGRIVQKAIPIQTGDDFNDVLMSRMTWGNA